MDVSLSIVRPVPAVLDASDPVAVYERGWQYVRVQVPVQGMWPARTGWLTETERVHLTRRELDWVTDEAYRLLDGGAAGFVEPELELFHARGGF